MVIKYNHNQQVESIVDFRFHNELRPIDLPLIASQSKGFKILKVITTLFVGFFGLFFFITAPSQIIRLQYTVAHARGDDRIKIIDPEKKAVSFSEAIASELNSKRFFRPITTIENINNPSINIKEGELLIPKIGVRAPIVWNSTFSDKELKDNLKKGVVHYYKTAFPNQVDGNVFLTGHSSDYWWNSGNYKTVFTLLDKLVKGDQAFVKYKGKIYVYEVIKFLTVSPKEIDVTNMTVDPTLSLMTCAPVGTAINRLIVRFNLLKVYES